MGGSLSFFFFFKQKTAYEMRISDWSSDVCSSDLRLRAQSGVLVLRLALGGEGGIIGHEPALVARWILKQVQDDGCRGRSPSNPIRHAELVSASIPRHSPEHADRAQPVRLYSC